MALADTDDEVRARRLLPTDVYEYFFGGAGNEDTLTANIEAWKRLRFRPRILRDVSSVDTALELHGMQLQSPVIAAPMAFHGLAHPEGEVASARGIGRHRLFVASTRSSIPLLPSAAWARRGGCRSTSCAIDHLPNNSCNERSMRERTR